VGDEITMSEERNFLYLLESSTKKYPMETTPQSSLPLSVAQILVAASSCLSLSPSSSPDRKERKKDLTDAGVAARGLHNRLSRP